jgi:hypothetical protein
LYAITRLHFVHISGRTPIILQNSQSDQKNAWKIANAISHHSLSPHAHTNMHLTSKLISPQKLNEDICYLSSTENIKITSSIQTNHLHDLTHFSTIWLYLYPSGKHIKHLFFSLYLLRMTNSGKWIFPHYYKILDFFYFVNLQWTNSG